MMIQWSKMFVVATSLILISGCGNKTNSKKGEAIKLELNYPPGFVQVIVSEMSNTGSPVLNMENRMEVKFTLDSVINKDTYLFSAHVLRISSTVTSDEETETYDSGKGDRDPDFDKLLGSPLSIKIGRNGKIVQPFQFASSQEDAGAVIDMSKIQINFPEEKVGLGDTWQAESTNELTSTITKTTYTLKEITDTEIKIGMTAVIEAAPGMISARKLEGEYRLDRKTNKLKEGRFETKLSSGGSLVFKTYEK